MGDEEGRPWALRPPSLLPALLALWPVHQSLACFSPLALTIILSPFPLWLSWHNVSSSNFLPRPFLFLRPRAAWREPCSDSCPWQALSGQLRLVLCLGLVAVV